MAYNFKEVAKMAKNGRKKEHLMQNKILHYQNGMDLVEFPYPSGQGLHVGHPRSYTALDIIARKKRNARI